MLFRATLLSLLLGVGLSTLAQGSSAQRTVRSAALPDSPSASAATAAGNSRLIGHRIYAQFANMVALPDGAYTPMTRGQKFNFFVRNTIAPSTLFGAVTDATWLQITGGMRGYGGGMEGWGKRFGSSLADNETRSFFKIFAFPALLHQDPRYFRKAKGGIISRGVYAMSRVVFTRSDDNRTVFNYSELLSVAASTSIQNAYYPDNYRSFGDTMSRLFGSFSSDASGYVVSEFMPDVLSFFHRHAPGPLRKIEKKIPPDILTNPAANPDNTKQTAPKDKAQPQG